MTVPSDEQVTQFKDTAYLIGDRWCLLVIWACLDGTTRFEELQRRLGIARNILSNRLGRLTDTGLLVRRPVVRGGRRLQYLPSPEAEALRPVFHAIRDWHGGWVEAPSASRGLGERVQQGAGS